MKNIIQQIRLTFLSNIFFFIAYSIHSILYNLRLKITKYMYIDLQYSIINIILIMLLNYVRSIVSFKNSYGSIKIKILCDFRLGYKSFYFIMEKKYLKT